jgi:hypothetical protein
MKCGKARFLVVAWPVAGWLSRLAGSAGSTGQMSVLLTRIDPDGNRIQRY